MFDIPVEDVNIIDRLELIIPAGHTGTRVKNPNAGFINKQWADGDFSANVTDDYLGLLLYAVLGNASTNSIPISVTPSLLVNERVNISPKSFVLANQPTAAGTAFLRFEIKGTQNAGTISVSGIDPDGKGASETISFASAGLLYSRNAYSFVGASSIQITGMTAANEASLTITGWRNYTHTFTPTSAPSGITLGIERLGIAETGNPANSFVYGGMTLQQLSLRATPGNNDGLFTVDTKWEGNTGATCTATIPNSASTQRVWPGWGVALTDPETGFTFRPTDVQIDINSGSGNGNVSPGGTTPAFTVFGETEISGRMSLILDNTDVGPYSTTWKTGATVPTLAFLFQPKHTLYTATGTSNFSYLQARLPMNLTNYSKGDKDGAQEVSFDFTVINSAEFPPDFTLVNGIPGY